MQITAGKVADGVTLGVGTVYSEPVNVTGCPRITFTGTSTAAAKVDIQMSQAGYDETAPWVTLQTVDISSSAPLNVTIETQCNHARLALHDGSGAVVRAWIHGQQHR